MVSDVLAEQGEAPRHTTLLAGHHVQHQYLGRRGERKAFSPSRHLASQSSFTPVVGGLKRGTQSGDSIIHLRKTQIQIAWFSQLHNY